jgi:Domain of unknown function (DUF5618)
MTRGSRERESLRYLENARELLRKSPMEDDTYTDIKYVQEGCATAYLAILKAIDEYLIGKGIETRDLPQSVDGYREMLRKYLPVHNGRLTREFEKLYKLPHIAGCYRGLLDDVSVVRDAFRVATKFIEKIRLNRMA